LAILKAVDAIAEVNPDVAPTGVDVPAPVPGAPVDYVPDTIVVLTDGANSQGVDPVTAAEQAAARRVRVYTIGFGTTEPAQMVCSPDQISSGAATGGRPFGGGGGGGGGRRLQEIDEPTLTEVAQLTGGEYYRAQNAESLTGVLLDLPSTIVLQREDAELTVWFALAGAVLVLGAVGLSLWWSRMSPLPRAIRSAAVARR
jgi:Ca-activated chloride channel family protein